MKISMKNPVVEMDGDEMTRIIWALVKEKLILPYVDLKTEYYDLGLKKRDETDDQITVDAANAAKRLGVTVKCATITPNAQRMEEYHLKRMYRSPNGTIRSILDGTVFRAPITAPFIRPAVRNWQLPITIARHAYGDVYRGTEYRVPCRGKAELLFTGEDGTSFRKTVYDYECPGVLEGIANKDSSIESFARSCFRYALSTGQDLWFSAKDTISRTYDGTFKEVFQRLYDTVYKADFEKKGLTYFYTLIDDAVSRVMRSRGGFIWALKNYDGDVMSDMISTAFGSLAMMTSILMSPDGKYEYEAAHGTVTRHYYRYLKGEKTSTNPIATIYAWTGALRKRGEMDGLPDLASFAGRLEKAVMDTLSQGIMTKDVALLAEGVETHPVDTWAFIDAVKTTLETA